MRVVTLARKSDVSGKVETILEHGCGAINVDGTRIGMRTSAEMQRSGKSTLGMFGIGSTSWKSSEKSPVGRWPTNVILDETQAKLVVHDAYRNISNFFWVV